MSSERENLSSKSLVWHRRVEVIYETDEKNLRHGQGTTKAQT